VPCPGKLVKAVAGTAVALCKLPPTALASGGSSLLSAPGRAVFLALVAFVMLGLACLVIQVCVCVCVFARARVCVCVWGQHIQCFLPSTDGMGRIQHDTCNTRSR
jgi:hypothetical protein